MNTLVREPARHILRSRKVSVKRGTAAFPLEEYWWNLLRESGYKKQIFPSAVWESDGTPGDIQGIHDNDAANGDTITVPDDAGTPFTWVTGISISKAIHLEGAGSGRIIARSTSSNTVGTGAKTFETQAGLAVTAGQTLTIRRTGGVIAGGAPTGAVAQMTGTVTSYSGTELVMDITSVVGSGTHPLWYISTPSSTTIIHNAGDISLIALTENAAGSVEMSGLRIINSSGGPNYSVNLGANDGEPILIHDCWFSSGGGSVRVKTNRGALWKCSFDSEPFSSAALGIAFKNESGTSSWTTAHTMGAADTTGRNNFYVEDCDFHAFLNCVDFDDNSRTVMRHCLFNNAGLASHGQDSAPSGLRHFEVYDCEMVFNPYSDGQTLNLNWWFFIRGGTFVITDCTLPSIDSQDFPGQVSFKMTVMNLQRQTGVNACWGMDIPGIQYPAPHQIGQGHDGVTDVLDPARIWGNSGAGAENVSVADYGLGIFESCVPTDHCDSVADYVQLNRDYYVGTARPGWSKFQYPHPLRSEAAQDPEAPMPHNPGSHRNKWQLLFEWSRLVGGNPKPSNNELKLLRQIYLATTP